VDKLIFTSEKLANQWEIKEDINCADCGEVKRGYRLVRAKNYDKTTDKDPQFRCEKCSEKKTGELRKIGIQI
jgi:hypothetical protein